MLNLHLLMPLHVHIMMHGKRVTVMEMRVLEKGRRDSKTASEI